MNNLSLARIMYGSNDGLHSEGSMNATAFSSLSQAASGTQIPAKRTPLSQFLLKAWAAVQSRF